MLTQLNMLLNSAIRADPLLCLANAICWLDPLWRSDGDEVYGDPLATGLLVAREAFPDTYAGAIERIRAGMPDREIDRYLCAEISKAGIPVDDLECLGYGIPLPAYGVRLEDPDFHEEIPTFMRRIPMCCRSWRCSALTRMRTRTSLTCPSRSTRSAGCSMSD